jgi:hypothetical protein
MKYYSSFLCILDYPTVGQLTLDIGHLSGADDDDARSVALKAAIAAYPTVDLDSGNVAFKLREIPIEMITDIIANDAKEAQEILAADIITETED